MARPNKNNIGTYPFDVDFFDNKIIVRINGEFGAKGIIIVVKLLCAVYEQGYFLKWSIDEQYLMKRYLSGISVELIDQVLQRLLKWGFFNNDLFKSDKILTSVEIQRNYFNAIKRRSIIHSNSFPYLLLNPQRPNDVSAYKNRINVCNNGISVNNNEENVAEMAINVNGGSNSGNNNKELKHFQNPINTTEKEFLHTKTGVSAYKKPDNDNNNYDFSNNNPNSAYKNPLDEHFATKRELLHTETEISANNNQGFCKQKPNEVKNNNPKIADNRGVNVNNNPNNLSNNGKTDNNNGNSDTNNTGNIIYDSIYNNNNNRNNNNNKTREQKNAFSEQKGKEGVDYFDSRISEVLKQQKWRESVCMKYHVEYEQFPQLLQQFKTHCISEGVTEHPDEKEFKQHFGRWLKYRDLPNAALVQNSTITKNQRNHGSTSNNRTSFGDYEERQSQFKEHIVTQLNTPYVEHDISGNY